MASGRPTNLEQAWYQKAAELMVRNGMSFRSCAEELGVAVNEQQVRNIPRSKTFQRLLWLERNKYYKELAHDPNRSKQTAIGMAILAIQKLAEQSEWDKVVDAVLKLGRIEGWIGGENNVNVFSSLTSEDIATAKGKIMDAMKNKSERIQ